jgi:hypothetical protein
MAQQERQDLLGHVFLFGVDDLGKRLELGLVLALLLLPLLVLGLVVESRRCKAEHATLVVF